MFKIIAETAFSHEGDFMYLQNQIEAAYSGKADFVKFQIILDVENYLCINHPSFDTLAQWTFSEKQWIEAFKLAKKFNLNIIALPLTINSLAFCMDSINYIDALEVHSISLNEHTMLDSLSKFKKKIILGIGGYRQESIQFAIKRVNSENIILMHGFQSFPTKKEDNNIGKIHSLSKTYPNFQLGFADHSSWNNNDFIELCNHAFFAGARYFEKHIVIEKGVERIDYSSGIESEDFVLLRDSLNSVLNILGETSLNTISENEQKYFNRRKRIFAVENLVKGTILQEKHFMYRIGFKNNESSEDYFSILNREVIEDIKKNEEITLDKIKNENN